MVNPSDHVKYSIGLHRPSWQVCCSSLPRLLLLPEKFLFLTSKAVTKYDFTKYENNYYLRPLLKWLLMSLGQQYTTCPKKFKLKKTSVVLENTIWFFGLRSQLNNIWSLWEHRATTPGQPDVAQRSWEGRPASPSAMIHCRPEDGKSDREERRSK